MAMKNTVLVALSEIKEKIELSDDDKQTVLARISHIHLFDDVKDFRQSGKITYRLPDLLLLVFFVILEEGKQSFEYIADYIEINKNRYEKLGLIHEGRCPSYDTLRRIFSLLDSGSLRNTTIERFYEFLKELEENKGMIHIAIDGKTINATGRKEGSRSARRNYNVLNVYSATHMTCLFSEVIDDKSNEIPAAQDLLSRMDLKNCVVTADALHCQRKTCEIIRSKGGHYVLNTKGNQELLEEDIRARLSEEGNRKRIKTVTDEKKKISVSVYRLPEGHDEEGFTGLRSYVKMESGKKKGKTTVRHFISDLIKEKDIFDAVDRRWALESHHQTKDVYLHEDEFRCTDRKAAKNIAIMNDVIVQLLNIYIPLSGYIPRKARIALRSRPIEQIMRLLNLIDSKQIRGKMMAVLKN